MTAYTRWGTTWSGFNQKLMTCRRHTLHSFISCAGAGIVLGALCGNALVSLNLLSETYYPIMVVTGMVSFLSASSRTPITAVTFAIEALCGLTNILPIAIGVTFAFLVIETSGTVQ